MTQIADQYAKLLEEFARQPPAERDLAYQKIVLYGAKLAEELKAITQLIDMMNRIDERAQAANDPTTSPEPEAA